MTRRVQRALITGASRGIGAAFARRLAAEGAALVLVARSTSDLDALAVELRDAHDADVEVIVADLGNPKHLAAVETRVASMHRPVDLLVNNAGFGSAGEFADLDVDRETQIIELNVIALTRLSHAGAGAMAARGHGAVINVSSITAFQPGPHGAVYAAGKAFVLSLSQAMHEELRGRGVKVQALCPGFTRTDIFEVAEADTSAVPDLLWQNTDQVVDAALKDLGRGVMVSVPGIHNRLLTTVSPRVPAVLRRGMSSWLGKRFL